MYDLYFSGFETGFAAVVFERKRPVSLTDEDIAACRKRAVGNCRAGKVDFAAALNVQVNLVKFGIGQINAGTADNLIGQGRFRPFAL